MESLFLRQKYLLSLISTKIVRDIMYDINWNKRLISIRGNRGVGKTTLMLQYIKLNYQPNTSEILYCSLDSLYFAKHSLIDLTNQFVLMGGKHLLLDEVHKYPNWSREVKEIFDSYPDLKVTISGSSLLNIINADADLSRRCRPYEMHGLSFREYLKFYHGIELPRFTLDQLLGNADLICDNVLSVIKPIPVFNNYLKEGFYPFFDGDKESYYIALENIINFIIDQEMPLLCGIDPAYTRKIKALLHIVSTSVPFEVDITKIGTMLELNRNTVITYLNKLEEGGLTHNLYSKEKSLKKMQKPDKIYINDCNMLHALAHIDDTKIGTLRETFAVSTLSVNHTIEYGKSAGDYVIDGKLTIEVGGKDKSFDQIADIPDSYILADNIERPIGKKIPLWLIGFSY